MLSSVAPVTPAPVPSRYELLHKLASGGMATVYLGRAKGLAGFERIVAIKCCHPHLRDDPEFVNMFLDEARLAAKIHHPNVVATVDVGEDDALFLVMEYIEGDRLSDVVKSARASGETIPVPIALRITVDTLTGLHAAHELVDPRGDRVEIIHRDVSPQNIMVGADGVTRIMDFGVAKAATCASITRTGQVKGKIGYMPPEQLLRHEVSRSVDVYAAGIVLWEALTGRRLFRGESESETMNLVLRSAVPPLSSDVPGVTAAIDAILSRAISRDPRNRFATASDFADAIESAGVEIANHRAVAAYLRRVRGTDLDARRQWIRSLIANPSAGTDLSLDESTATSTLNQLSAVQTTPSAAADRAIRSSVRRTSLLVGLLACVLFGAGLWMHYRRQSNANRPIASAQPSRASESPPAVRSEPAIAPPTPIAEAPDASVSSIDAAIVSEPTHASRTSRSHHRHTNSVRRSAHQNTNAPFNPGGL
jgi:serine/threonine-protein kinase